MHGDADTEMLDQPAHGNRGNWGGRLIVTAVVVSIAFQPVSESPECSRLQGEKATQTRAQ